MAGKSIPLMVSAMGRASESLGISLDFMVILRDLTLFNMI
jgi:hypothetical protein